MKVDTLHGILLVNKPAGLTSHDVVDRVRRHFRLFKVGHTGTLDPLATGLLILTVGKGTKLTNQLIADQKEYQATCLLGVETDTQDIQGKILKEAATDQITEKEVEKVVLSFLGAQEQIPPMFSAKKKDGKKLYELARNGIEVEREPKSIHIVDIRIEAFHLPKFRFLVSCSKGTYIRTLCHDMGQKLKCGGTLFALNRVRCGLFHLENAVSLTDLLVHDREYLKTVLIPLSELNLHESAQAI